MHYYSCGMKRREPGRSRALKGGGILLRVISGISRGEWSLMALWIEPQVQCQFSSNSVCSGLSLAAHWLQEVSQEQPKHPRRCSHLILKMSLQRREGRVWGLPGPRSFVIFPSWNPKPRVQSVCARPGLGPTYRSSLGDPCQPRSSPCCDRWNEKLRDERSIHFPGAWLDLGTGQGSKGKPSPRPGKGEAGLCPPLHQRLFWKNKWFDLGWFFYLSLKWVEQDVWIWAAQRCEKLCCGSGPLLRQNRMCSSVQCFWREKVEALGSEQNPPGLLQLGICLWPPLPPTHPCSFCCHQGCGKKGCSLGSRGIDISMPQQRPFPTACDGSGFSTPHPLPCCPHPGKGRLQESIRHVQWQGVRGAVRENHHPHPTGQGCGWNTWPSVKCEFQINRTELLGASALVFAKFGSPHGPQHQAGHQEQRKLPSGALSPFLCELLPFHQTLVPSSKTTLRKIENAPVVQWLGLTAFTASIFTVPSLIWKLRSCKLRGMDKK